MNDQVKLRSPQPDDLNFIRSSWLKSNHKSDFCNYIPNDLYYDKHAKLVDNLIQRSLVSIACNPEDENHVYGYAVYELIDNILILHYIYIKYPFRNFGLSKMILTAIYPEFTKQDFFLTHIDITIPRIKNGEIKRNSWFIQNQKKYKMNFNPYLMIR